MHQVSFPEYTRFTSKRCFTFLLECTRLPFQDVPDSLPKRTSLSFQDAPEFTYKMHLTSFPACTSSKKRMLSSKKSTSLFFPECIRPTSQNVPGFLSSMHQAFFLDCSRLHFQNALHSLPRMHQTSIRACMALPSFLKLSCPPIFYSLPEPSRWPLLQSFLSSFFFPL